MRGQMFLKMCFINFPNVSQSLWPNYYCYDRQRKWEGSFWSLECDQRIHGVTCSIWKAFSVSKMFLNSFTFLSSLPQSFWMGFLPCVCHTLPPIWIFLSHPSKPCESFFCLFIFFINYKKNCCSRWFFTFGWLGEVWKWSGNYALFKELVYE